MAYRVVEHREVKKFLKKHPDLKGRWNSIEESILQHPRFGSHIDHLKGNWHCSYRWDEWGYRIKYEVDDSLEQIYFYDAGLRGDVYKRDRGEARR